MYLPFRENGVFCLSFHYHMYGINMGILDVFVLERKREHIVWRMSGYRGTDWLFGEVLMRLREGDQVRLKRQPSHNNNNNNNNNTV